MREKHLLRTLATGLATMAIPVFSPMTLTAQTHSKLPPEVQAKRAAAKSAQQKKGHSARKAKATGVQLYAYQVSTDCDHDLGLYTFNTASPDGIRLVSSAVNNYGGATYAQGTFFSTHYAESQDGTKITMPIRLYGYDTTTWSQASEWLGYDFTNISADLTFDPETQALFGLFSDADYSGNYATLGRVTTENLEQEGHTFTLFHTEPIGQLPESMVALAANRNGQLYAFGTSGKLYTVDKFSGKTTLVGSTGVSIVPFKQSATCDYTTGKLYWAALDADTWASKIVEVDPATASSTLLANFGFDEEDYSGEGTYDQFTGLYLKQDLQLATLPAAVSGLKVSMTSLNEAAVAFTMPTADVKGTPLTGTLNYTVRLNGESVATGTAAPGATISLPVATTESGSAIFGVTAEIPAQGETPAAISATAKAQAQAGHDAPKAPADFKAQANGADITLTWTASTESAHGGSFDKNDVTYSVFRFLKGNDSDSVTVADHIKATTCTDHIDTQDKKTYYYKLMAFNHDAQSETVKSDFVTVGLTVPLPYQNKLDTQDAFAEMDVVDANADGSTWTFDPNFSMASYTANSQNAADDWLIAPAVAVKKGAAYKFSFDAVNSYPDERVAAAVGTAPTAEGMTDEVIAPTVVSYQPRRRTLLGTFRATEDGVRYFGVHAVSNRDRSTLYVDHLQITEIPSTAPNPVSALSVTPGEKGATTAKIVFKAPTTSLGGDNLTGELQVTISRNGESLTTFTHVEPGSEVSYDDPSVPQGEVKYAVTATNAAGENGLEATAEAFIGDDEPGEVLNLRAYEDENTEGLIHVTWDAPKGKHGGYIDPAGLTYYVSVGSERTDRNVGTATHFEDQLDVKNGKQKYSAYSVYAVNSAGGGRKNWLTVTAIGGPALQAPMIESFKNATMKSGPWITKVTKGKIGEAYCYVMTESTTAVPEDLDGGMQSFSAEQNGKAVRSESPKVNISQLAHPVLNFWAYMNGKGEKLRVSVQKNYKDFELVKEVSTDQYQPGWQRFSIDLTPFKDSKYIRVGIEGESVADLHDFMAYDNVAIIDDVTNDLMALSLTADVTEVAAGDDAVLNFTIRNNAATSVNASDYDVVLLKNGKEVNRTKGEDLAPDKATNFLLSDKASVLDSVATVYAARIDYAADKCPGNNTAESDTFKIVMPDYPAPSALSATSGKGQAELSWTAPDLVNRKAQAVTETFDDYQAFIINDVGDWTMYDADLQNTIRITINELFGPLQYDNAGKPMAFQVFNVEGAGIPYRSWDPHSGDQMLVSFSCASNDGGFSKKQNDDWVISPELNGTEQNIRFFAKAGTSAAIPERMEVLYSTTDKAVSSFTKMGETIDVTNGATWDEYNFTLPEGAKYFAIRCVSHDKLALLIDDITYTPAGAVPEELNFLGYNVYRDGQLLNDAPVKDEAFNDPTAVNNESYTYLVTALYDKGESVPSAPAELTFLSGLQGVQAANISVSGGEGLISVKGANGMTVQVFSASGMLESRFVAGNATTFRASAGLHIVSVGGKAYKVLVK